MESLHENEMALKEFQMLEEDANVFKMIGPVLVKQDSKEAQENVKRRLEYFKVSLTIEYVGRDHPDSVYNFGVAESRMLAKSCK